MPELKMIGPTVHSCSDLSDEHGRVRLMWNRIGGAGHRNNDFTQQLEKATKAILTPGIHGIPQIRETVIF